MGGEEIGLGCDGRSRAEHKRCLLSAKGLGSLSSTSFESLYSAERFGMRMERCMQDWLDCLKTS